MDDFMGKVKQDHDKYLNLNHDEILNGLTEDELRQLDLDFEEIDPDVSNYTYAITDLYLIFLINS